MPHSVSTKELPKEQAEAVKSLAEEIGIPVDMEEESQSATAKTETEGRPSPPVPQEQETAKQELETKPEETKTEEPKEISLSELLALYPDTEEFEIGGKILKRADLEDAENHRRNAREWRRENTERSTRLKAEEEFWKNQGPIFQTLLNDHDKRERVRRFLHYLDHPEEARQFLERTTKPPTQESDEALMDELIDTEKKPSLPPRTEVLSPTLQARLERLEKANELLMKERELQAEADANIMLDELLATAAEWAKEQGIKWTDKHTRDFLQILSDSNGLISAVNAYRAVTYEDAIALAATTSADKAEATARQSKPTPVPTLPGQGIGTTVTEAVKITPEVAALAAELDVPLSLIEKYGRGTAK